MRITGVSAIPLRCDISRRFAYSQKWFTRRTALLVRVDTDEGVSGWGECFCHDSWPALVAMIEQVYQPLLIGKDPLAREVIWDTLYNWTRDYGQKGTTAIAISGVDIALWDILGQATGLPIYRLLGGPFRQQVRAYATGLYLTEVAAADPAALADEAAGYAAQGFVAVKLKVGFGLQHDVRAVQAVRAAIGPGVRLMVDANHAYDVPAATALGRALEQYDISWFEEPVVPEDIEGYGALRRALSIPIAGGECEYTRYGFRRLISAQAVDILQPDICVAGGLSEALKIAALASAFHVRLTPHVWGTGVALAAALHFIAAQPEHPPSLFADGALLEFDRTENPLRERLLLRSIQPLQGMVQVPQGPGLGIEIDTTQLHAFEVR